MSQLIVVGINTEVGKTVVAAIVTEALVGYYWKPIQCGLPSDRDWVEKHLSLKKRCFPESYSLKAPFSPHLAARIENIHISAKNLHPPTCPRPLIIEGTGGLLSPLSETESWADAAVLWKTLGIKTHWILVHRHYLGSLNHFFLTIEAIRARKLPLLGVVFNGEGDAETEEMLLQRANTLCLGRLAWQKTWEPALIQELARQWSPALRAIGL